MVHSLQTLKNGEIKLYLRTKSIQMTLLNKPIAAKSGLLTALLISLVSFSFASKPIPGRVISLAGLVINAQTLLPIESAKILDNEGHTLGTTNKDGYYKIRFT